MTKPKAFVVEAEFTKSPPQLYPNLTLKNHYPSGKERCAHDPFFIYITVQVNCS